MQSSQLKRECKALPMSILPAEPAGASRRAYVTAVALVAAISGFLFGFDTAVINGALVFLRAEFHLSDLQVEMAASSLLIGCVVGAAACGPLTDRFGRRRILAAAGLLFAISALGAAIPHSLAQFATARGIGGIAIGVASMLAPVYIAEVAPAAVRGLLVAFNQLALVSGILASYATNLALSRLGMSSWRLMFGVAVIPAVIFVISLKWVPESPRWLVERGRVAEAHRVLERTLGEAAQSELALIRVAIARESGRWMELFAPGMRRALAVGVALAILQQACGINVVIYYGSLIFSETFAGSSTTAALRASVLLGSINLVATILAATLIDKVGRKPLLLVSAVVMGLGQAALGAVFLLRSPPGMLVVSIMLICVAAFAIGLGPCLWVLVAEIFPTRVRGRAASVATVALWLAATVMTSTFLTLSSAVGMSGAFWLYGAFCLCAAGLTWFAIPETKGRSLEQIEELWTPSGDGSAVTRNSITNATSPRASLSTQRD